MFIKILPTLVLGLLVFANKIFGQTLATLATLALKKDSIALHACSVCCLWCAKIKRGNDIAVGTDLGITIISYALTCSAICANIYIVTLFIYKEPK